MLQNPLPPFRYKGWFTWKSPPSSPSSSLFFFFFFYYFSSGGALWSGFGLFHFVPISNPLSTSPPLSPTGYVEEVFSFSLYHYCANASAAHPSPWNSLLEWIQYRFPRENVLSFPFRLNQYPARTRVGPTPTVFLMGFVMILGSEYYRGVQEKGVEVWWPPLTFTHISVSSYVICALVRANEWLID